MSSMQRLGEDDAAVDEEMQQKGLMLKSEQYRPRRKDAFTRKVGQALFLFTTIIITMIMKVLMIGMILMSRTMMRIMMTTMSMTMMTTMTRMTIMTRMSMTMMMMMMVMTTTMANLRPGSAD